MNDYNGTRREIFKRNITITVVYFILGGLVTRRFWVPDILSIIQFILMGVVFPIGFIYVVGEWVEYFKKKK